ncbi:MAG: preprotein translocase subunit SecG [Symbiobacteriia bacterium]
MCYNTRACCEEVQKGLYAFLVVVHVLITLGLIATVLLQSGKAAGLSGAVTGGAEQVFGKKKGMDEVLSRVSTGLAIAFMVTSISLTLLRG